MAPIHRLIDSGAWEAVRDRLNSSQKDVLFRSSNTDEGGANPFHIACSKKDVPQDIIRAILAIDGSNLNTGLAEGDGCNATPLHLACETGSAATVRTLLMLASDDAEGARDCSLQGDGDGDTALYMAWFRHFSYFSIANSSIYLSLSGTETNVDVASSMSEFLLNLDRVDSPNDLEGNIKDTWDKTILLLKACTTGSVDGCFANGGQWNVIHSIAYAALHRPTQCPSMVLWLALKLFPEQAGWKDREGDLPLHIVSSASDLAKIKLDEELVGNAQSIHEETAHDAIDMLLKHYPDAAKITNKDGRLPLHISLEKQTPHESTVVSLLKAAPKSVDTRDPVTRLLPFMLAAAGPWRDKDEGLDTVYYLLRENPENVQSGIRLTEYEEYLTAKLAEREQQRESDLAKIAELESRLKKRKHDC